MTTTNENNEWCGYWQRKHILQESRIALIARRKIYANQIQRKLDSPERKRKQILHHLAIAEGKITTLNDTITIMSNTPKYSIDLFIYRTCKRHFKGKRHNMLLSILHQQPVFFDFVGDCS